MAQAFGIESRLPYLDHRVVEYVAAIPPHLKMRGLTEKYVLKEVARKHLPPEMFQREEPWVAAPFYREVFMNPRSFLVNELLSPSALKQAGYLGPAFVASLLDRFRKERDPVMSATYFFLLERALLLQGIHHVFIRQASPMSRVAALLKRVSGKCFP